MSAVEGLIPFFNPDYAVIDYSKGTAWLCSSPSSHQGACSPLGQTVNEGPVHTEEKPVNLF